jgi:hypothetical protein
MNQPVMYGAYNPETMQIVDACTPEELEEGETYYTVPLYTKPDTERQPLTDKQITEILGDNYSAAVRHALVVLIRATEAMHGIGGDV